MLDLLKNRIILSLIGSMFFLQLGVWIRNFTILLYVIEKTNKNPIAISLISIAEYGPILIFSFIGGALADRWRAKKTMIWCDFLSAISVFLVFLTLLIGSWKVIFLSTLLSTLFSQVSVPASVKMFKTHLEDRYIQPAIALNQTIIATFMIMGPVIGTIVYQYLGVYQSFLLIGSLFLLSVLSLLFLPNDKKEKVEISKPNLFKELRIGFQYIRTRKELVLLGVCFSIAGLAIGLIQPLNVFIVIENLNLDKSFLSVLLMINGLGMIVGGVVSLIVANKVSVHKSLLFSVILTALAVSIIGFSKIVWITLMAQFIYGLCLPIIQISINTVLLRNTDEKFIGRVNGLITPLYTGSMILTILISGMVKNHLSLVSIFQISAIFFLIAVIFILPLKNSDGSKNFDKERANSY